MPAKVLVSGASGFLAGHVVQQLQAAGYVVRGTVRSVKNQEKVQHLYKLCPNAAHPLQLVEADLTKSDTWSLAVKGMDYVIHTASPFPLGPLKNDDEVVRPAVEGTLAVLRACAKEPSVKRVVITSSAVAIDWNIEQATPTPVVKSEADWTDADKVSGYIKSKVLAEKAAWDFVRDLPGTDNRFELVVLNPSLIVGPPLQGSSCTSVEIFKMLLAGQMAKLPGVHFNINDVRDCAAAHVQALTVPEAAGKRHIITSGGMWFPEMGRLLHCVFGPQGYKVPTGTVPTWVLWLASFFSSQAKSMYRDIGIQHAYNNRRMLEVLKIKPRATRDTIIDMAYGVIEAGFVKKTDEYRGPGGPEERQKYMQVQLS